MDSRAGVSCPFPAAVWRVYCSLISTIPGHTGPSNVKWQGHKLYVIMLTCVAASMTVVLGFHGADYYTTPLSERPFHPQYDELKPSGVTSHGYGILGSLMIITGVAMYSSRKRLRILSGIGKLPAFLEFHIFLCLTGPILVLYHTTFKFGGLVAVSFWSMTAIVLSGIVGRYLYVQIPRGIQGHELTVAELEKDLGRMTARLMFDFALSAETIERIDNLSDARAGTRNAGLVKILWFLIVDDLFRSRAISSSVRALGLRHDAEHGLASAFHARHVLHRRILLLEQVRRFFHYWHVIHVPFSIIMFVILFVHVGVAIAFGYRWVF